MSLSSGQIVLVILGVVEIAFFLAIYLYQFYTMCRNRSVFGISNLFVIGSNVQNLLVLCNGIVFYLPSLRSCHQVSTEVCFSQALAIIQFLLSYLCSVSYAVIYLIFYRTALVVDSNDEVTTAAAAAAATTAAASEPSTPITPITTTLTVRYPRLRWLQLKLRNYTNPTYYPLQALLLLLVNATLLITILVLLAKQDWYSDVVTVDLAATTGYVCAIIGIIQFLPQYYTLYLAKDASNLSLTTYFTLAIGNTAYFLFLLFQVDSDYSTWASYLSEACLQSLFSSQIVYYDYRRKIGLFKWLNRLRSNTNNNTVDDINSRTTTTILSDMTSSQLHHVGGSSRSLLLSSSSNTNQQPEMVETGWFNNP